MAEPLNLDYEGADTGARLSTLRAAGAERPWARRRFQVFILLFFAAQVLFVVVFSERRAAALKPAPFGTGIHLVSDQWSVEQLAAFSEFSDPSVFALPTLDGFSRSGWLMYNTVPDEFAETPGEPKWLEPDPEALGTQFTEYVATNTVAPLRIGDQLPEIVGQPRPSAELEFPKSELRMGGTLARRKLIATPNLPSWPHTEVLTNSVVHLVVEADGTPISAALIASSGLKDADNYALAASKRLRFRRGRAGETVASGTANFRWHTLPPGAAATILSPGFAPPP